MVVSDLARAVLMGVGAALIAVDAPAASVYATAIVATIVGVVFRPAQAALLPRLARDPAELTAANVASSTIESVASFVGPALGGLLLVVAGPEVVFAVNGLSFVWSAALVLGIHSTRADDDGAAPRERPSFVRELTGGIGAIAGERAVATVTGLYTAQTLVAGATNVLVVVAAIDLLGAGDAGCRVPQRRSGRRRDRRRLRCARPRHARRDSRPTSRWASCSAGCRSLRSGSSPTFPSRSPRWR